MTDLTLNIRGDSSEARTEVSALGETIKKLDDAVGVSTVAIAKGFMAAGAAVAAFAGLSLKAYADSERTSRQLQRAAGDYTSKLEKQAAALAKLYAVDDDIIKQSQTLLVQWGGVAAASNDAEKAALNLSVAMGGDLRSATEDLIRNVESGGTGLAKMGIHFKATGDKGKDFEAAVAAINSKLGGAAATDAASLTGQLRAVGNAFEDIQESIGGSISKFIQQTGLVAKLTGAMRDLNGLFTPSIEARKEDPAGMIQFWEQVASGNATAWKDQAAGIKFTFEEAQAELAQWRAKLRPADFNVDEGGPRITGTTNKGLKGGDAKSDEADAHSARMAAVYEKNIEAMRQAQKDEDAVDEHSRQQDLKDYADELALEGRRVSDALEIRKAGQKAYDDIRLEEEKKTAAHAEKVAGLEKQKQDESVKDSMDRSAKKASEAGAAGAAIGTAFVNALSDQLSKLAAGEEFDVALFVGDILASVIAIAGTVIGTAYGQPALGAAVGNMAAMGVRAGASAISKDSKPRKKPKTYHSGGWVDDDIDVPRYHSGAWIGGDERRAILQTDERVASRQEVANAGGRAALDSVLKGRGGGPTIINNIQAIDSKNAAESFMSDLGQGMKRALRTGHGDVPRLLGMSPR